MKITNEIVELGPDYTSSPLTIGDRWLTWPEEGTPPTVPSTLKLYQTTQSPNRLASIMKTPPMNGKKIVCYILNKARLQLTII